MIYTVTLNPSIDYIVEVDHFEIHSLNRMKRDNKFPGGKGINVSRVLSRMGIENTALGFLGGFTGNFVEDFLKRETVNCDFTRIQEDTRINIKLKADGETEINGMGPHITQAQYEELVSKIKKLNQGDTLVLAGSVPPSIAEDFYVTAAKTAAENGVSVVVDTSGPSLLDVVKHRPFLIKPNHHELGDLFSVQIESPSDAVYYAGKLVEMGALHVIVSMAGSGAVLCTKENSWFASVPKGSVINSVGAGDSVVAGFTGMYTKTGDLLRSFAYGLAAGSATAFSHDLCQKSDIEDLLHQVNIQELKEEVK
ncbi:1-phosphofructokinase [Peribacillus kribbensis]|uniref:1-phosphofructokinase n=1 Tax=Peribacillus kribbensis TaxID=356658 RepID=UPI0004257E80|nr:1-phosphofructokinase [Peribacillus kribbensis]